MQCPSISCKLHALNGLGKHNSMITLYCDPHTQFKFSTSSPGWGAVLYCGCSGDFFFPSIVWRTSVVTQWVCHCVYTKEDFGPHVTVGYMLASYLWYSWSCVHLKCCCKLPVEKETHHLCDCAVGIQLHFLIELDLYGQDHTGFGAMYWKTSSVILWYWCRLVFEILICSQCWVKICSGSSTELWN